MSSWRPHIWKFLFQIYPFNSTQRYIIITSSYIHYHRHHHHYYYYYYYYCCCYIREQKTIDIENRAKYKALHERWVVLDKTVNLPDEEPSSDPLEYLLSSDDEDGDRIGTLTLSVFVSFYLFPATKSAVYNFAEQVSLMDTASTQAPLTYHEGGDHLSAETCPHCNKKRTESSTDTEGLALLQILEFPSSVYATRQPVDLIKSYPKSKRVILRDVKRTDRTMHYFR